MRRSGPPRASLRPRPTGLDLWVRGRWRVMHKHQVKKREKGEASLLAMRSIKTQSKILTLAELATKACDFRANGLVVVQAHGTFDLLHLGHVRHLEAARALGDVLVVTVTADRFVNKGPGRPAFTETLRAEMLAALHFVSCVAIAEAPDAISAIATQVTK